MEGESEKKIVPESKNDNNELEDNNHDVEEIGLSLEKLNIIIAPTKKLLVLGLGGFLCYRIWSFDEPNVPTSRAHDSSYNNYLIYRRSHCEEFMRFCLERFEVGIWASSTKYNTIKTLDCVMEGLESNLLFAWGQNECTDTEFESMEKVTKPLFVKELSKIWEIDDEFSSSNTLLIDDKPYKSLLNPDYNSIFPEPYQVDDEDNALGPEGELRNYLEKLVKANDVPSFVKENPIGQMAINPDHCDWSYYSMIIDKFKKT